jgi:hypothetical protein
LSKWYQYTGAKALIISTTGNVHGSTITEIETETEDRKWKTETEREGPETDETEREKERDRGRRSMREREKRTIHAQRTGGYGRIIPGKKGTINNKVAG